MFETTTQRCLYNQGCFSFFFFSLQIATSHSFSPDVLLFGLKSGTRDTSGIVILWKSTSSKGWEPQTKPVDPKGVDSVSPSVSPNKTLETKKQPERWKIWKMQTTTVSVQVFKSATWKYGNFKKTNIGTKSEHNKNPSHFNLSLIPSPPRPEDLRAKEEHSLTSEKGANLRRSLRWMV